MRLKFNFLIIILLMLPFALVAEDVIVLEGNYQLRNIYVSNKIVSSGVGFCVTNVFVNGEVSPDEINSEAFEIDLSLYNFNIGTPVTVEIFYKEGCLPNIINPLALKPQATFKTENIKLNGDILEWTSVNETGSLPYQVQQFKWNKWVKVGEIKGEGSPEIHEYKYKVNPVSGKNRFRVIQKSGDGRTKVSPEVDFTSSKPQLTFEYSKKEKSVNFTGETSFEMYDAYGRIIKRGFSNKINVEDLEKGVYYINYDNTFSEFKK